jgi:hypothetical protein
LAVLVCNKPFNTPTAVAGLKHGVQAT